MGSKSFFKVGLDPLGSQLGSLIGNNSSFAKFAYDSPLINSKFGKVMSPSLYEDGQTYDKALHPAPSAGGSFVNVAPTLNDANNSYVQAAGAAAGKTPAGSTFTPPVPKAVSGAQSPYVMSLYGGQQQPRSGGLYGQ